MLGCCWSLSGALPNMRRWKTRWWRRQSCWKRRCSTITRLRPCLPLWMARRWALRCISLISPRSSDIRACILRICLCGQSIEEKDMARRCCCILQPSHGRSIADGWSGVASTGTSPASTSISRLGPSP